jgi:c-opsin
MAVDVYHVNSFLVLLVFVFGLTSQLVTVRVLLHHDNRPNQLTPFLVNIAVANTVMIFSCYPIAFVSSLSNSWVGGSVGCDIQGLLTGTSAMVSIVTIFAFTLKIYRHVTSRNVAVVASRKFRSQKTLAGIWVYSLLCMIPPLLGWSSMTVQFGNTNCAPNWVTGDAQGLTYLIFLITSAFAWPVVGTAILLYNLRIFFKSNVCISNPAAALIAYQRYKIVVRIVGVVMMLGMIAWSPYVIYSLANSINGGSSSPLTSMIPAYIAKASSVLNPIVYWMMNPR